MIWDVTPYRLENIHRHFEVSSALFAMVNSRK